MPRYAAFCQEILTSSIWAESVDTRIVFMTMIISADETGVVRASAGGLQHLARVPMPAVLAALKVLQNPDPDSRTSDHEGRRVEKVEGGWKLLNFAKYQGAVAPKKPTDKRKEQMREYVRRKRAEDRKETQQDLVLEGGEVIKANDRLPVSKEALFCADLYRRRRTTVWHPKEIKAFKVAMKAGVFTPENMEALQKYYAQEMPLGDNGNHRRDLLTFLNNITGEIDRANARLLNNARRINGNTTSHSSPAAASAANSGTSNAAHAKKY